MSTRFPPIWSEDQTIQQTHFLTILNYRNKGCSKRLYFLTILNCRNKGCPGKGLFAELVRVWKPRIIDFLWNPVKKNSKSAICNNGQCQWEGSGVSPADTFHSVDSGLARGWETILRQRAKKCFSFIKRIWSSTHNIQNTVKYSQAVFTGVEGKGLSFIVDTEISSLIEN